MKTFVFTVFLLLFPIASSAHQSRDAVAHVDFARVLDRMEYDFRTGLGEVQAELRILEDHRYEEEAARIEREFRAGETDYHEASRRMRELIARTGPHLAPYMAVEERNWGAPLNNMAIVRSQAATAKGFPTWAAYKWGGSTSVEGQRSFLDHRIAKWSARLVGPVSPRFALSYRLPHVSWFVELEGRHVVMALFTYLRDKFILELWDYNYSAPNATTFLKRVENLDSMLTWLGLPTYMETHIPMHYAWLSSHDVVNGEVRHPCELGLTPLVSAP